MFSELVESGSHSAETRRKGKYFLATLTFYGLLLVATGVGSIYAYNVRVEDRAGYELIALMRFEEARTEERRAGPIKRGPTRSTGAPALDSRPAKVRELAHDHPNLRDRPVAAEGTPVLSPRLPVEIGSNTDIPEGFGSPGGTPASNLTRDGTEATDGPVIKGLVEPPPLKVRPTPAPTPKQNTQPISLPASVITGKAIEKPAPPYPPLARQMGIHGMVPVQIVVDEAGRVISAKATGGHALLQRAAAQAAYGARFEPTRIGGQPVKVTGVITYNFILQN